MASRRFWTIEEQSGNFLRTLDMRFRALSEILDSDMARAVFGRSSSSLNAAHNFAQPTFPVSATLPEQTDLGTIALGAIADAPAATAAAAKPASSDSDGTVWVAPNMFGFSAIAPSESETITPVAASFLSPPGGGEFVLFYQPEGGLAAGVSLLIDADKREILTGHDGEHPDLTAGGDDQMVLGGGMAPGTHLGGVAAGIEQLVLLPGFDYGISASDSDVAAGDVLSVVATGLGGEDHLDFDGSAETDGAFSIIGGRGGDHLVGGAGDDDFFGLAGADVLAGGGGADVFHYGSASESTGAGYDSLVGFDYGADSIDLPVTVTGRDASVTQGALSTASFDADLAAALNGKLGSGHAAFFTPDSGDLAGQVFLVVDANGQAGYQAGQDYVFHVDAPPPPDIGGIAFFV